MAVTFLTDEDEKKFVKSINNTTPDENGNVKITIPDSGGNVDWLDPEDGEVFTAIVSTPDEPDVPDIPDEPEVTLSSISATYTGGNVAVGTAVTALTGITVTAHYSDGSTEPVTGYTLSGEIVEGSNTITVSYGGKTTTFTVTGESEESGWVPEDFTGTDDMFIRDGYIYANPLTFQLTDWKADPNASDTSPYVLIQMQVPAWGDLSNGSADRDLFGNTIPFIGEDNVNNIRAGTTYTDYDFGWMTNPAHDYVRIRIPRTVYEAAGSDVSAALHGITERFALRLNSDYENYLYEVTDELIDGMTGTPSTTLTADGFYNGFLNWAGIGVNSLYGAGTACIPFGNAYCDGTKYETYGIKITSRFYYCVPSTADTSSLENFKAYLKTRGIKFLCNQSKVVA